MERLTDCNNNNNNKERGSIMGIVSGNYYSVVIAFVWIVVAIVFTLVNWDSLVLDTDSPGFISLGRNILSERRFCNDSGVANTFRTPGYPLFLSLIYTVFGDAYMPVVVIQIILTGVTILMIGKIFRIFDVRKWVGIVGLLLYLFDLTLYIYSSNIMSDILFYDCLVAATLFFACFLHTNKSRYLILYAVSMSYALLTRPILIYYNILLCIVILICALLKKVKMRDGLICIAIMLGVFLGWSFRNYMQAGVFEYSSVRNCNMVYFDASVLRSNMEGITFDEAQQEFNREFDVEYQDVDKDQLTQSQFYLKASKLGRRYIQNHFLAYIKQNITGLITELIGPNKTFLEKTIDSRGINCVITILYVGYLGGIYLLYTVFLLHNMFKKKRLKAMDCFVFTIAGYCAAASASLGYARFRVAYFGLLIMGMILLYNDSYFGGLNSFTEE